MKISKRTSAKKKSDKKETIRFEGLLTWLIKVVEFDEETVYKNSGIEVLLYLAYMKYTAILFMVMFFLGGIPLILCYILASRNLGLQTNLDRLRI